MSIQIKETIGTKHHRLHTKRAIRNKFRRGGRCWTLYWKTDKILDELAKGKPVDTS